uniref:Putative LAGLIDADG homing endonuclease n=1 Tax=Entransia fimbriata TaxID=130991 RepID=U5YE01_9VIRI|nr:putative LAGLIDADG homing endonuclease [Entransia fimbriata]AGZ90314.1 putative LAGLIDADG homing endonuclease [Entransia fimbriata]
MIPITTYSITGFTEADGNFYVKISKSKQHKNKYRIKLIFNRTQDQKSLSVLHEIKNFWKAGFVTKNPFERDNCHKFIVNSHKHIFKKGIPHFTKFALERKSCTEAADTRGDALHMGIHSHSCGCACPSTGNTKHLSESKSISVSAGATSGSNRLQSDFITGLFDGDGSFFISFRTNGKISPHFTCGANGDEVLLKKLQSFFDCGHIYKINETYSRWVVNDLRSICTKRIPHFSIYELRTSKKTIF